MRKIGDEQNEKPQQQHSTETHRRASERKSFFWHGGYEIIYYNMIIIKYTAGRCICYFNHALALFRFRHGRDTYAKLLDRAIVCVCVCVVVCMRLWRNSNVDTINKWAKKEIKAALGFHIRADKQQLKIPHTKWICSQMSLLNSQPISNNRATLIPLLSAKECAPN